MLILLLTNCKFWLAITVSALISAFIPKMPAETFMVALTLIGVLFGGALTGAAVVTSLINEEGLRRIYERKKQNYDRLLYAMEASLGLLLTALTIVVILFFVPTDESTLALNTGRWQTVIPVWRLLHFCVIASVGVSLFAAWEVVEAVIGMSRIRFELTAPKGQAEKRAENN